MPQATLDTYVESPAEPLPGITCRADWGPTMDTPIPEPPTVLPNGRDARHLKGTGLAPGDFEILNGQVSPAVARDLGYHPDDQYRRDQYEEEEDDPGAQEALAKQHELAGETTQDFGGFMLPKVVD